MRGGTEVRRLGTADLPAYKSLRDEVLAAHPSAFTSDAAQARALPADSYRGRLGLDRDGGGDFLAGAFDGAALVGAICCEREQRAKARHVGHIVGMMVRDGHQGRGVGRALLAHCVALARAADGLEMLTLTVTAGNLPAIALYRSFGFVHCGSLPRAIKVDGIYHAKEQMALLLAAA